MAYDIRIKWLGVACFEMQFGNTTLVADPFVTDSDATDLTWKDVEHCELITLSHAHWDHITDIPKLMDAFPQALLMTGDQTLMPMVEWLGCNPTRIYPVYPNTELDFGDVKVRGLYGHHTNLNRTVSELNAWFSETPVCLKNPEIMPLQLIGTTEYRNYVYTAANGTKVLFWGGAPIDIQRRLMAGIAPDIAILQLTSAPEDVALLAKDIGCKIVIPHHMDLRVPKDEYVKKVTQLRNRFKELVPDGQVICPVHGQWMEFSEFHSTDSF